jgi:predicted nucleic-acid-binding Zn-ribbon protein
MNVTKKAGKDYDANECPFCGYSEFEDDFDMGNIFIDPDLGFISLSMKCPQCRKWLDIFYDHTRTEHSGVEAKKRGDTREVPEEE